MVDDFTRNGITREDLRDQAVLQHVNKILENHSKSVRDYDLPELQVLFEYQSTIVFNKVMDAITERTGQMIFLDGPGGSGKTLL
ncbi:hypothetical protein BC829DRAFT_383174, partial [Chytridium lagenaria]